MKAWNFVVGIVLVSLGFYLFFMAICFQHRVDVNNEFLKMNKSMPSLYYDYIVSFNASMKVIIPLYISVGIILIIIAGCLCFHPKVKVLALLVLLSLSILNVPTALAATGSERWYAELFLQQPRNAEAIGGHIYVYGNHLSNDVYSFVAFRIALVRVDTAWKRMEWLEAGFFEDHTGFWIYAASYIGEKYVETRYNSFHGEGCDGRGYYSFEISQKYDLYTGKPIPNRFEARFVYFPIMEATFTIGGDNLWMAGSESNDPENSLEGHYASLWFYTDDWHDWTDITTKADLPYSVAMGSTNEFFTDGTVDLDDLYIIALAFGTKPGDTNWNPDADLTKDNVVDVSDLCIAALHFGEH